MTIQELGNDYLSEAQKIEDYLERLEVQQKKCKQFYEQQELEKRIQLLTMIYLEMHSTGNYLLNYPCSKQKKKS